MGYFKQQEVADQEQVDRLVAWYKYHQDKLPTSYIQWLLKDDELLWKAIEYWETVPYGPKPARSHVALNTRDHIRAERAVKRQGDRDALTVIGSVSVIVAVCTVALLFVLEVL